MAAPRRAPGAQAQRSATTPPRRRPASAGVAPSSRPGARCPTPGCVRPSRAGARRPRRRPDEVQLPARVTSNGVGAAAPRLAEGAVRESTTEGPNSGSAATPPWGPSRRARGRRASPGRGSFHPGSRAAPLWLLERGLGWPGSAVDATHGRRGKQPDGSAKTREVKLVTVWTAEGRDPQGRPRRDTGSVSYNAAVESAASRDTDPQPAAFAQRAHREAQRRGFDTAPRRVVIGDGPVRSLAEASKTACSAARGRKPPRREDGNRRGERTETAVPDGCR